MAYNKNRTNGVRNILTVIKMDDVILCLKNVCSMWWKIVSGLLTQPSKYTVNERKTTNRIADL